MTKSQLIKELIPFGAEGTRGYFTYDFESEEVNIPRGEIGKVYYDDEEIYFLGDSQEIEIVIEDSAEVHVPRLGHFVWSC